MLLSHKMSSSARWSCTRASGAWTWRRIDWTPSVADYLIAEGAGSCVEILGTDHGQKLVGRHSNRKKQINVDACVGELSESLRTGPGHVLHADGEGGTLVVLDIGA